MRFLTVLVAYLLCAACQPVLGLFQDDSVKPSDLIYSTDRTAYQADDSVVLGLENPTKADL